MEDVSSHPQGQKVFLVEQRVKPRSPHRSDKS